MSAAIVRGHVRFQTAREFSNTTPEQTEWVVEPYVPRGGIAKIDGAPKRAGKTTLITHMIACVIAGSDFIGRPTRKGPVILVSEQGDTSLREALEKAGLLESEVLYIASVRDTGSLSWRQVVADVLALAKDIGATLIAIDTLPAVARIRGDDENSAGRALEALEPLQIGAAELNVGVVLTFHERKGGGEVGESGRGSSGFSGAVDVIMRIDRPGGNFGPTVRRIEALSRYSATPSEQYVELTSAGYVSCGYQNDIVTAAIREKLVTVLPNSSEEAKPIAAIKLNGSIVEPGILEELAALGVQPARSTLDRELERWVEAGYAGRSGAGKRGSPVRFWLKSPPPESFFRYRAFDPSEESHHAFAGVESERESGAPEDPSGAPLPLPEETIRGGSQEENGRRISSDASNPYIGGIVAPNGPALGSRQNSAADLFAGTPRVRQ